MKYPDFFDQILLNKRERLISEGYEPYPYDYNITHKINDLKSDADNHITKKTVIKISGRIWSIRTAGKALFMNIKDDTDNIQLYAKLESVGEKTWKLLTTLTDIGDFVYVSGLLFYTRTNELTLDISEAQMLSKSVVRLPVSKETNDKKYYEVNDPEIQYRERYIFWNINDEAKKLMLMRSKIISLIRNWMELEGFIEVQTPTVEMVYGGAEARPFETNIWALDRQKAYLRISPELYLKRYIVAGFEKVYTICQNFRNEGIDKSHNPEFSMMEWYETGTDYVAQMERFEKLVEYLVLQLHGTSKIIYQDKLIDFKTPWKRLSVVDALKEYENIDPISMTHQELYDWLVKKGVKVDLETPKGVLIVEAFEEFCEKHLIQPTFVIDHPKEISPLTKEKRGLPGFVERFEPFVNAMEIGNAYSELTDPVEQFERLAEQRDFKNRDGDYENHPIDYDFVKAIGIGMPPTGGVGIGIDRIIMLLTNAASIRDIIPFPMMKPKL